MKRKLVIILSALCLVLNASNALAKETEHNVWAIEEVVDEFGDSIDEKYLRSISKGTFSNDKVKDVEFDAYVNYYPERYAFSFYLMENENTKIANSGDSLLKIKLKGIIYEYDLLDDAHDDGFLLSFESNPTGYMQIWNELLEGTNVKCLIYTGDTKCQFVIPATMFSETMEPFIKNTYDEAIKTFENGDFSKAATMFSLLGEYLDSADQAASAHEAKMRQNYEIALELFSDGEYDEAKAMFMDLNGYLDSSDLIRKCKDAIEANAPDISGTIIGTTTDSLNIQSDDGNTYCIYYGEANINSVDGIYEGVYVEINLDRNKSFSDGTLYATDVTGY